MFCIEPYCSQACSGTMFFAWARLVYQTSLKLKLKLDLFINKQTWTSFLSSKVWVVHKWLGSFTALHSYMINLMILLISSLFSLLLRGISRKKCSSKQRKMRLSGNCWLAKWYLQRIHLGHSQVGALLFYDLLYEMHLVYSKECEAINKASWICWGKMN